jgi:hypothetical protein
MRAALGRHGPIKPRAGAVDSLAHPTWRKIVAGTMAFIVALTLGAVGLLLCSGPTVAP